MAIDKKLKEIEATDLDALIKSEVREGKTIEFKSALDLRDPPAKRKFLASVASFANASGGDMVFGIRAQDGVAKEVVPLANFNPDQDTLALRDIIRSRIAPTIYGFDFKAVSIAGGYALVLRIPKTWAGAHMVTFQEDNRFYVRDNNGKRSMDVAEVRAAFVGGEAIAEKVKRYRQERLADILADETPVLLAGPARFVLHLVPLRAFEPGFLVDLKTASDLSASLRPINYPESSSGRDIDGYYRWSQGRDGNWSYVHLSTNGCIEAVEARLLHPMEPGKKLIRSILFERELLKSFSEYLEFLKQVQIEPPLVVMLSLLNVRGYSMSESFLAIGQNVHSINRDMVILPGVTLDDLDVNPEVALRPLLNGIWHACGYWQSPHFTAGGKWQPQP